MLCGGVTEETMLTKRENYLVAAKGGKPEWVPSFVEDCNVLHPDIWNEINPETGTDFCNIKWTENAVSYTH